VRLHVLQDDDDPAALVRGLHETFGLPDHPRVAVGDATRGATVSALQALLPAAAFVSASDCCGRCGRSSPPAEIDVMRRAGAITEAAFAAVLERLEHGMTELDVVSEIDHQLRRHGSLGPSFTTSLYVSGPHHPLRFGQREATWKRPLTPPVSILFDFGAILDGYCYDFGRTVFFGEPDAGYRHRRAGDGVAGGGHRGPAGGHGHRCRGRRSGARRDRSGRSRRDVPPPARARDRSRRPRAALPDGRRSTPLQEGMLFTVEPSITRFDTFSARVEDVVLVRPDGGEPLTTAFRELLVVA
jgi:Xaa-Pro dipeptidase